MELKVKLELHLNVVRESDEKLSERVMEVCAP